ncbi:SH3 domain-containing protein [Streptococcus sp. DD12]|uniref:SH3 domain-containing protein n=1 Tax=Streptococcus sp. DD12 TaxID=1777880 RepID=UPI000799B721|nr:SH3 domain-containing protein [Streptococcus sp. DD12]KXT76965.1 Surface antigen-related protein [Streptococcus sp. DD12]
MTKSLKGRLAAGLLLLASLGLVACNQQTTRQSATSSTSSTKVSQTQSSPSSTTPASSSSTPAENASSSSQDSSTASETTPASQTSPSYTDTISVGTYTFKNTVPVKASPQESAETDFYFNPGDSVTAAQRFTNDNHIWIAYPDYSGQTHYAMIE